MCPKVKTDFYLVFYFTSYGQFCIQEQNLNFYNPLPIKGVLVV